MYNINRTDSIPIRLSVVHNSLGDLKLLVKITFGFTDFVKSVDKNLLTLLFGRLQLGGHFFQSPDLQARLRVYLTTTNNGLIAIGA